MSLDPIKASQIHKTGLTNNEAPIQNITSELKQEGRTQADEVSPVAYLADEVTTLEGGLKADPKSPKAKQHPELNFEKHTQASSGEKQRQDLKTIPVTDTNGLKYIVLEKSTEIILRNGSQKQIDDLQKKLQSA